jgi:hypothetical protein
VPAPAAKADASQRHAKTHKHHKHAAARVGPPPVEAAPPVPAEEYDVELVQATTPPVLLPVPPASSALRLTAREWMLMGLGGAAALVAVAVGVVLAKAF